MKNVRRVIFALTISLLFILSSCATPAPETVIVVVTATGEASTESPTAESLPTLGPIQVSGPASGEVMKWIDNSTLVYIPAGEFSMGDNIYGAEHTVNLS